MSPENLIPQVDEPMPTARELEILHLLWNGTTSHKEIASLLSISPNTVKTHIFNLQKKLQTEPESEPDTDRNNEIKLLRKAIECGILSIEPSIDISTTIIYQMGAEVHALEELTKL